VAHWLRNCVTTRTVAGSIVSWEFFDNNPSGRNMAPVSTQSVTETSIRNIYSGVMAAVA
jgi:hypothetical protein